MSEEFFDKKAHSAHRDTSSGRRNEPTSFDDSEEIKDLRPLGAISTRSVIETDFENKSLADIKEAELDKNHKRQIQKIKTYSGAFIYILTITFVLAVIGAILWKMLLIVSEPTSPQEDKKLAIGIIAAVLSSVLTLILTKGLDFFNPKD